MIGVTRSTHRPLIAVAVLAIGLLAACGSGHRDARADACRIAADIRAHGANRGSADCEGSAARAWVTLSVATLPKGRAKVRVEGRLLEPRPRDRRICDHAGITLIAEPGGSGLLPVAADAAQRVLGGTCRL